MSVKASRENRAAKHGTPRPSKTSSWPTFAVTLRPKYDKMLELKADAWTEYLGTFIQRIPRYAVKLPGRTWRTKSKPLTDRPIKAHLAGQYAVAVLGSAYPLYGILDVDDRGHDEAERIREALGLDSSTSMLMESESPNSYHVIFKPEYNSRPPSIRLLGDMFKSFARANRIEVYPQWRHAVRLPFGPKQTPADEEYMRIVSWEDAVHFFGKLDEFNLKNVPQSQFELELPIIGKPKARLGLEAPTVGRPPSFKFGDVQELFEHGLQAPGTRNNSQFQILYRLFRENVPQVQAELIVWTWIQKKHNGFSKDILRYPQAVRAELTRQATRIWGFYHFSRVLPDAPALTHEGYITKPDILEVIKATHGNLPRSRFLHSLVKFMNPRRYRLSVGVSSGLLLSWASRRTYNRYLKELGVLGIVRRGRPYQVGKFSKSIKMLWPWARQDEAVLYEGRAVEGFDEAVRLILKPDEFRQVLEAQGPKRTTVIEAVKAVFSQRRASNEIPLILKPKEQEKREEREDEE